MDQLDRWQHLARQLRVDSIRCSVAAGSGHPTSSLSAAELMAVLESCYFRFDLSTPTDGCNDHLVFSKGHATPLLYSMLKAAGAISDEELLTYRRLGSRLQGHPVPPLPWVDVATGSLGQGLPIAVGIALAGKRLDRLPFRVWVLCGDGEMAEGSMAEAMEHAAFYDLDNLIAIVDVNRLGQTGETMHGWDLAAYRRRAESYGWHAIEVDGHDVRAIDRAYAEATGTVGRPTMIVARTVKGQGIAAVADRNGFHGRALPDPEGAIRELGGASDIRVSLALPESSVSEPERSPESWMPPRYEVGSAFATRKVYGEALAALGSARPEVIALDGEVSNSTFSELFRQAHPTRYFEMYISEQQLIAAAIGLHVRGWVPFASTFAAFLTRAHDFIRMAAVSGASIRIVGSHAGVSIGEDGPSQMALEDLAMFRSIHGSTVLYPCDANQTTRLVELMADRPGISYLRTTREPTPVIYGPDEPFAIGGSKVIRVSGRDRITLIGAGVTLHEALEAAATLERGAIHARVIDCYSIKPIDVATLRAAAQATPAGFVVVEDHHPEGGLGEAVTSVLSTMPGRVPVAHLAVATMPGSATPKEQRRAAGIDAQSIAEAARRLLSDARPSVDPSV